jgi:hypothetical protein
VWQGQVVGEEDVAHDEEIDVGPMRRHVYDGDTGDE